MGMNEFIVTENLSKNFSGVQALESVSISINRGEVHCLAGENGSGKSTFIKLIAGSTNRMVETYSLMVNHIKTSSPLMPYAKVFKLSIRISPFFQT